jgi:hypothetical protein
MTDEELCKRLRAYWGVWDATRAAGKSLTDSAADRVEELLRERDAIAREAQACFDAQSDIDEAWDAIGTRGNKKVLSLSEQIASLMREFDDVADTAGVAREAALKEAEKALREWQDNLILCGYSEAPVTVGMSADLVAALIAEPPMPAPDLPDPVVVHANMLRGTIAKPGVEQIVHLYGVDTLCKALVPTIVREAVQSAPSVTDDAAWNAAIRAAAKMADEGMDSHRAIAADIRTLLKP